MSQPIATKHHDGAPVSDPISVIHYVAEVRLELGGVVQAVIDLCQAIAANGHRVTLATCDATDVPEDWRQDNHGTPDVVTLDTSTRWSGAVKKPILSRRGKREFEELLPSAEIVHLHTPWELSNYQVAPCVRRVNLPYIVTAHGMLDDWSMRQKNFKKRAFLKFMGRKLFRHAAAVHLTAEGEFEQASQWVPIGDRAAVQCYALDLTSYSPLPGPDLALAAYPQIKEDKQKLLFLSRLHPKKGVDLLIKASALLRDAGHQVQLLVAGPGDPQYVAELESLVDDLDVREETEFLGMVRGVEKRSLFELADVFVLPTHQENFGLAITEAMACGTPVVTTRGTDIWHEVERGGARIADLTPESLAEKLSEFLSDPEMARSEGERGYHFVRDWLDRAAVTAGYEQLYRETIKKGAPT